MSVWCAQIFCPRSLLRHFTTRRPDQSTDSPHSHAKNWSFEQVQYNDNVDGRYGERGIWLCKGPRRCCSCLLLAERWTHLPYQPCLLLWWQRMARFGHRLIIYQLYWSLILPNWSCQSPIRSLPIILPPPPPLLYLLIQRSFQSSPKLLPPVNHWGITFDQQH